MEVSKMKRIRQRIKKIRELEEYIEEHWRHGDLYDEHGITQKYLSIQEEMKRLNDEIINEIPDPIIREHVKDQLIYAWSSVKDWVIFRDYSPGYRSMAGWVPTNIVYCAVNMRTGAHRHAVFDSQDRRGWFIKKLRRDTGERHVVFKVFDPETLKMYRIRVPDDVFWAFLVPPIVEHIRKAKKGLLTRDDLARAKLIGEKTSESEVERIMNDYKRMEILGECRFELGAKGWEVDE